MTLAVVGEAVIDLVQRGGSDAYVAHPGGSPLNVAVGLARLGHRTELLARLSTSAFGQRMRAHAEQNGVGLAYAVSAPEAATLAVVSLDNDGSASYDFYMAGTADWQWTAPELARPPAGTTVLHTGSLATLLEPGATHIAAMLTEVRAAGEVLISVDPNLRPALLGSPDLVRPRVEQLVSLAHLVKASDEDIAWLYPGTAAEAVARMWLDLGPDLVVITSGSAGSTALTRRLSLRQPAQPVKVVDTVGAGDAFTAGLLSALVRRDAAQPEQAGGLNELVLGDVLREAAVAAALTCARPGADPPSQAELTRFLAR